MSWLILEYIRSLFCHVGDQQQSHQQDLPIYHLYRRKIYPLILRVQSTRRTRPYKQSGTPSTWHSNYLNKSMDVIVELVLNLYTLITLHSMPNLTPYNWIYLQSRTIYPVQQNDGVELTMSIYRRKYTHLGSHFRNRYKNASYFFTVLVAITLQLVMSR